MRFLILLPFLCVFGLLAAPLAAATDPTAPSLVRTGSLEIALDPDAVSFLPVDSEELRLNLCNGLLQVDGVGTISPRGECDLVVSPPPRLGLFLHDVTSLAGSWRVSLQAVPGKSGLWKGSGAVSTSCGSWKVSMALDPSTPQPVSELALEPSATDPKQGVFAGPLKLAVRYRFHKDGAVAFELPATVSIELSGHWMAVPEGGPSLGADASNLVLFAGVFSGVLDGVPGNYAAGVPTCATWGGVRCQICVEPPPDVLDRLSPSFNP